MRGDGGGWEEAGGKRGGMEKGGGRGGRCTEGVGGRGGWGGSLSARGGLAAALQADEHDDVCAPFFGDEGLHARVQHGAQLVENGFLDDPALVNAAAKLFEINFSFDVLLQLADHLDVDVAFQQRGGDFLYKRIQTLCGQTIRACIINQHTFKLTRHLDR